MKHETARPLAYRMRMSPEVAAYTINKDVVALKLPLVFPPGTLLYMVEYAGAPTGRADICTVLGTDGDKLLLARRWNWHQGKQDDDLAFLSIALEPDVFPMATAAAIP